MLRTNRAVCHCVGPELGPKDLRQLWVAQRLPIPLWVRRFDYALGCFGGHSPGLHDWEFDGGFCGLKLMFSMISGFITSCRIKT